MLYPLRTAPRDEAAHGTPAGFVALDNFLDRPQARRVHVELAEGADFDALLAHIQRRAWASQTEALGIHHLGLTPQCWALAEALGLENVSTEPFGAAEQLARRLKRRGQAVWLVLERPGSWDRAFCEQLLEEAQRLELNLSLIVATGKLPAEERIGAESEPRFVVSGQFQQAERRRWWQALATWAADHEWGDGLAGAQARWGGLLPRSAQADQQAQGSLASSAALELQALLRALGRPWPRKQLDELPSSATIGADTVEEALAKGLLKSAGPLVMATKDGEGTEPSERGLNPQQRAALRALLVERFPGESWCLMQAALLANTDRLYAGARRDFERACQLADEGTRSGYHRVWEQALASQPAADAFRAKLSAAEACLRVGDAEGAQRWSELALQTERGFEAMSLLARAALGKGDLVSARVAVKQALSLARQPDELATAKVVLGEIRYAAGELEDARQVLTEVVTAADEGGRLWLDARNTLGKLLLAQGKWSEAEAHFAEDECISGLANQRQEQLRACLNRAVAVLSSGRYADARPMLGAVLQAGEEQRENRAVAFALSNLAVLATLDNDYGEALRLSERAILVRRNLGEKLSLVRVITNLAELRLRVGMINAAEDALAFGRRALGVAVNSPRQAHFALVAARIALARRNTHVAEKQIQVALAGASGSSDGDMRREALRVAARIALEDGNLARTEAALERAAEAGGGADAQADLAVIRASLAQAKGEDFAELANVAHELARQAHEEELILQALRLCADAAYHQGDQAQTQSTLDAADRIIDEVSVSLPKGLRNHYLGRPSIRHLRGLRGRMAAMAEGLAQTGSAHGPSGEPKRRTRSATQLLQSTHPRMQSLLAAIPRLGGVDTTLLVHGESGTGKELVAEALHNASRRRQGPLVKVNCGALVESLLLSELFGHERGAFTGATSRRKGRFETARGGTLFLDEIGDISPKTQVALLRVLQERKFQRVGSTKTIEADVRIICATHRDLREMVERGEFRHDLYFRLSGVVLELPSLRERVSDLPGIASNILQRLAGESKAAPKTLDTSALRLLQSYPWPGNIRELENVLKAVCVFAEGPELSADDLLQHIHVLAPYARVFESPGIRAAEVLEQAQQVPETLGSPEAPASQRAGAMIYAELQAGEGALLEVKRAIEKECISRALRDTNGNITKAAGILGMKRPRLSQLVKQYGLGTHQAEGSLP